MSSGEVCGRSQTFDRSTRDWRVCSLVSQCSEIDLKGCAYRSAVQTMQMSAYDRIFGKTSVLCAIGACLRRAMAEEGLPEQIRVLLARLETVERTARADASKNVHDQMI